MLGWLQTHPGATALFWDWLSLPQKQLPVGRTTEEQERFQRSLGVMLHLYASPRISVLQQKAMPIRSLFNERLNTRPYHQRGWCVVEQYTALSVNVKEKVADISRGYYVPASGNRIDPGELAELLDKVTMANPHVALHIRSALVLHHFVDAFITFTFGRLVRCRTGALHRQRGSDARAAALHLLLPEGHCSRRGA